MLGCGEFALMFEMFLVMKVLWVEVEGAAAVGLMVEGGGRWLRLLGGCTLGRSN